jgi:hypothetical protein
MDIESALDWYRIMDVFVVDDHGTPADFKRSYSVPIPTSTPENKQNEFESV